LAASLLVINTHADWDHCWGNQALLPGRAGLGTLFVGDAAEAPLPYVADWRTLGERHQEA